MSRCAVFESVFFCSDPEWYEEHSHNMSSMGYKFSPEQIEHRKYDKLLSEKGEFFETIGEAIDYIDKHDGISQSIFTETDDIEKSFTVSKVIYSNILPGTINDGDIEDKGYIYYVFEILR